MKLEVKNVAYCIAWIFLFFYIFLKQFIIVDHIYFLLCSQQYSSIQFWSVLCFSMFYTVWSLWWFSLWVLLCLFTSPQVTINAPSGVNTHTHAHSHYFIFPFEQSLWSNTSALRANSSEALPLAGLLCVITASPTHSIIRARWRCVLPDVLMSRSGGADGIEGLAAVSCAEWMNRTVKCVLRCRVTLPQSTDQ